MLDPERIETLRAALAERERIEREIVALNETVDRGIGQRTARLSNLSAWETALARVDRRLDELSDGRARDGEWRVDVEAVRALLGGADA